MSATTTTTELNVEKLPEFDQDPELAYAVTAATDYLRELLVQHHIDPAKRTLIWGASSSVPFEYVAAHLRETDRYGSRQADRNLSRKRMLDPVARDDLMSNLLMDVLRQRWYQVGEVIDRGIRELEKEEQSDGQPG